MATIQADESGVVVRANPQAQLVEKYRDRADAAHTVELDASTNAALLKEIGDLCQTDQNDFTIVNGVLKRAGIDVPLGAESDTAAIHRLAGNLTPAKLSGLGAGAKSFVEGLTDNSPEHHQALGFVITRILRIEAEVRIEG